MAAVDLVSRQLRAATEYGLQTFFGTHVDAIMTISSQIQEYVPSKVLSYAIVTYDGGNDRE